MPILKVFADKSQVGGVLEKSTLIEPYDAFVVVDAPPSSAKALAREFPVEDITEQYRVRIGGRRVNTLANRAATAAASFPPAKPKATSSGSALPPGPHHYIVQFIGPIKQSWLTRVRALGAKIRNPFGSYGYVVKASDATLRKIEALNFVLCTAHLPYSDRLAPGLAGSSAAKSKLPRRRARPGVFTVQVFDSADVPKIARAARALGFTVLSTEPSACLLVVRSESDAAALRKELEELAKVHGVRFVRQRVIPRPSNSVATGLMGNTFTAMAPTGLRLSGSGEVIAVCDTGLDTGDSITIHPDFAGRIVAIKSYPITADWTSVILNPGGNDGPADLDSGHGTHVAGSVLGNGTASAGGPALIRGHAYKAKLVFQAIEQEMKWRPNAPVEYRKERFILAGIPTDLAPLFQFAYNQGARTHSNSWGGGDPGAYDDQCRQFDDFVWKHKDFCFVIAAGNDGTDRDGDGKINPGSVTSPGTAKNCITVGACENERPEFNAERYGDWWEDDYPVGPFKGAPMADHPNQVVAFSSRGPTADNRIKPDIVAPGTFILSTRSTVLAPNNFAWAAYPPNKKYFHMGGTSMATPLVAGAVALVREFLRTRQGVASPTAALVKALLIAGAQRLPGTARAGTLADNAQGFGRVNLDRALKQPLATIEGPGLTTGKKSTYTIVIPSTSKTVRIAMAYSDAPGEKLVNNLNLMVTDASGKRFLGNQSGSSSTALTFDTTNNVEVVQVSNPKKGAWTMEVIASNVSHGRQDFAIAVVLV